MKIPDSKHRYRRKKEDPKLPRYFAEIIGLANDSLGGTIDGTYRMIQGFASYSVGFCPLPHRPHPPYSVARFYGDCLSYELDSPVVVFPSRSEFYSHRFDFLPIDRPLPSLRPKLDYVYETYTKEFVRALESVWSMHSGGILSVSYCSRELNYDTDFPLTQEYCSVARELQLYAHALRQLDPLGEFLAYYRILESVLKTNAMVWITSNLSRIGSYPIGSVAIKHGLTSREADLFLLYRRRALLRLAQLRKRLSSDESIAKYLYAENRCGIAHAKGQIRQSDFGSDYFSITKDNYIVKLLARTAIEDKRCGKI